MRLFGKKKSSAPVRDDPPPNISRPRAQGHLPPTTTAPKPSLSSRRSSGSEQPVTTPLYARFARTDSFESLSLRAKPGADSRVPSYAPTQQELEQDAQRLGYDRPWARDIMNALENSEPAQPQPASTIRVVSNPTKPADKRVSLEAVAAADPFMASKMQSIMRRAPSNVRSPDPAPKRSVTAPPNSTPTNPPPPRVPTAPPTRSVSAKSPPPSSRPSFDDDDTHSKPAPAGTKRERGPPPVAGTHSAYAWKSGQSDDGHGGSNFYTGGSQSNPMPIPQAPPSSFALPPGAAPPDPHRSTSISSSTLKKRTPSNPPTNRTPAPQGRRMSMDAGNARPLSGGPGTWGGSAIPLPVPPQGKERDREMVHANSTEPGSYVTSPGTTYGDLSRAPTVRSVQPGEIFHHPGTVPMPLPVSVSAPYQAVIAPVKSVSASGSVVPPRQAPPQPSQPVQRQVTSPPPPPPPQAQVVQPPQAQVIQPTQAPPPRPTPITTSPLAQPKKPTSTPGLPPGAAPASPTGAYKHSPSSYSPGYSAYGPTPGSAYGSYGPNGNVNEGRKGSQAQAQVGQDVKAQVGQDTKAPQASQDTRVQTQATQDIRTQTRPTETLDQSTSQVSDARAATQLSTSQARTLDARKSQASDVRTIHGLGEPRPSQSSELPTRPAQHRSVPIESALDARNSTYSGASSVSVVPPSTPHPPPSPTKSKSAPRSTTSSPVRSRDLPPRPGPSPLPPSSLRDHTIPPRAPSSMSVSSYGTALPLESEPGSEVPHPPPASKLALGGLAPINTAPLRSGSPTPTATSTTMVTARMTPTTSSALSPATIPSLPSSTPQRALGPGLGVPRSVSPTPTASTTRLDDSDSESAHVRKRNLLVKTRKVDGASSFRSSEDRPGPASPGPGLGGEDPFARAPPMIVKTPQRVQEPAPRRAMPLSPPLSSDDHDTHRVPNGLDTQRDDKSPMTPALTDEEAEEELAEPESTTPPGSPPLPKIYPLETHLNMPSLLAALLPHLSFRDWNALNALNAGLRRQLEETRALREEVLEYWLRGVGYARWKAHKREPLALTLRDLNAYMRGVSIAVYRYSAIAESFLAVRAQQEQTKERVPGAASKGNLVRALASSCRAYTKVILRLREQADFMHPDGDFRSPLFKVGNAPLLRVFVPSKEGAWLSDTSVLDCEKELKRAGALSVLRVGDVIWDAAVGDEGNAGRMVWDGNYLVDLDYTYSTTGELPKYIHSLAFSPSYWHKIIRTSNSPLCHIDLTPYAAEIAANLQLVQDRVQTETPQGGRHTVVRWVHRSRFHTRPGMPIPGVSPPAVVDRMWDGYIIVEVEGTNEGLADLQTRVGNAVRLFPAKTAGMEFGPPTGKSPFRLLRSASRPGEIWMRAVREKEKLL